jgi:hypothetical protein
MYVLTHFVLHELRELSRIVPGIYDVLHQELLLDRTKLFLRVLIFVETSARFDLAIVISVVYFLARAILDWFDHVLYLFYLFVIL